MKATIRNNPRKLINRPKIFVLRTTLVFINPSFGLSEGNYSYQLFFTIALTFTITIITFAIISFILSVVITIIMFLLLNPGVMLGMIWVYKIFRITTVADWLLIVAAFKLLILSSVVFMISPGLPIIHYYFMGIV